MRTASQKVVAISLSALLLLSTLSIQVDMHFCGRHLVDLGIGRAAATCGMQAEGAASSGDCIMARMNCCTDVEFCLLAQDEIKPDVSGPFTIIAPYYAALTPAVYEPWNFSLGPLPPPAFSDYSPPPLIRPVHLVYESLLL